MNRLLVRLSAIAVLAVSVACTRDTMIHTYIPERPAGQEDMIAYAAPAMDSVRIGFIGLGMRGGSRSQDEPD